MSLARVVRYGQIRAADPGSVPTFADIRAGAAAPIVERVLSEDADGRWLDPSETRQLLEAYGIPLARFAYVRGHHGRRCGRARDRAAGRAQGRCRRGRAQAARPARSRSGSPPWTRYARRYAASGRVSGRPARRHRPGDEPARSRADHRGRPRSRVRTAGRLRQRRDERRAVPRSTHATRALTTRQADELVRAPRGARLLDGSRGQPAADIAAVTSVLHRVSQLAADIPEVAEIDCNPLIAHPDGVQRRAMHGYASSASSAACRPGSGRPRARRGGADAAPPACHGSPDPTASARHRPHAHAPRPRMRRSVLGPTAQCGPRPAAPSGGRSHTSGRSARARAGRTVTACRSARRRPPKGLR